MKTARRRFIDILAASTSPLLSKSTHAAFSAGEWWGVIVDGLSTAVAATPFERARTFLEDGGAEQAWLLDRNDREIVYQSEKS